MQNQAYLPVNEERTPHSRISKTSNSEQGFTGYVTRLSINVLKERRFQKGMEELLEAHQREKDTDRSRKAHKRATGRISEFSSELDSLNTSNLRSSFVLENRHAHTFKLKESTRGLKAAPARSKSHNGGTKHSLYKKQSLYVIKKESPADQSQVNYQDKAMAHFNDDRSESTFLPDNFTFIPKRVYDSDFRVLRKFHLQRPVCGISLHRVDVSFFQTTLVNQGGTFFSRGRSKFRSSVVWASSVLTPLHVAFFDDYSVFWTIFENLSNSVFLIDMILTFVAAYYDRYEVLVTIHKRIAVSYLKGWFFIDLVSILPLQLATGSVANQLGKMVRLPRVQNLIRTAKLFGTT